MGRLNSSLKEDANTNVELLWLNDIVAWVSSCGRDTSMGHRHCDIIYYSSEFFGIHSHIPDVNPAPLDVRITIQHSDRIWPCRQVGKAAKFSLLVDTAPLSKILHIIRQSRGDRKEKELSWTAITQQQKIKHEGKRGKRKEGKKWLKKKNRTLDWHVEFRDKSRQMSGLWGLKCSGP